MSGIQYTYDHQYYLDVSDGAESGPKFVRVTDDESFNPTNDDSKYTPKYKCNKTSPEYTSARKTSIEMDIDMVENQELQDWLMRHEDDVNVPTKVVRVWSFSDGTSTAKEADFAMTLNPIDGDAEGALKAKGTLSMTSDGWTKGKFDPTNGVFTPEDSAPAPSPEPEPEPQG